MKRKASEAPEEPVERESKRPKVECRYPPSTYLAHQPSCDDLGINIPGMCIFNSKPGGGKSHLLRYLMFANRHRFAYGICFSKTAFREGNLDYIPYFEGSEEDRARYLNFKHMMYSEAALQALLDKQKGYKDADRPCCFIIFDDDISDPGMFNTPAFIDAATMYRHYNTWICVCTQYINKLSTTARECASQVT